jgi:putative FmdB family regulatory protein
MPLYEYVCQDCGHRFELLRLMKDADTPAECLKCKSENIKRKLALFNAKSEGRVVVGNGGGSCAGCSSGSCASCGH